MTTTEVAIRQPTDEGRAIAAFQSQEKFETAQRIALMLSKSAFVPKEYQGQAGVANCMVAMELAARTGASVLMVMQNLDVIHGKPSWRSTFLVAAVNACGRFSPLRYEFEGTEGKPEWRCRAVARDLGSGDSLEGEWISWDMANKEGWVNRNGSKWKTMPGQMMRYRAAAFWSRVYAPEIALGFYTADEVHEMGGGAEPSIGAQDLSAALQQVQEAEVVEEEHTPATTKQLKGLEELRTKGREAGVLSSRDEQMIEHALEVRDREGVLSVTKAISSLLVGAAKDADGQQSILEG